MAFMYGKWKAVEAVKALRERYGENSTVLARDKLNQIKKEKTPHAFEELLNKKFLVPQYPVDERFQDSPIKTFLITNEQKATTALRRVAVQKTQFDD